MNSRDFFEGLKSDREDFSEKVAGAEHFIRLKKQAGYKQAAEIEETLGKEEGDPAEERRESEVRMRFRKVLEKRGLDLRMALPVAIGAAIGGVATSRSSRPREELGGKSLDEDTTGRLVRDQQGRPEEGFVRKIVNRGTELTHGLSRAFREHPTKATALGATVGALGGASIGRLMGLGKGGK